MLLVGAGLLAASAVAGPSSSAGPQASDAEKARVGGAVRRLECVECGRTSREDERGWTTRLTVDDEVVVYCPECDEREFTNRDE
jgi:Zn ribbon nucleic-acid-binding protein